MTAATLRAGVLRGAPSRAWRGLRAGALRAVSSAACRLPEGVLLAFMSPLGELWYRLAPGRAEQGRRNLGRVCRWLVEHDMADQRVRAAAADPAALERLLRSAFGHAARYYLEVARAPALARHELDERLVIETPDMVDEAFAIGPVIYVGLHFGAIELPALYYARRTGRRVTVPMETVADPGIQRWFEETRGSVGVHIVGLREARRELLAALARGEPVGLVGDRDLTGGGITAELFGAPVSLPVGPGLLAMESGAPLYVASVRRAGRSYRGRLEPLAMPVEGSRRERLTALLAAEAAAFERAIALAPDQWWSIFFPIWPDLRVERPGGRGAGRRGASGRGGTGGPGAGRRGAGGRGADARRSAA